MKIAEARKRLKDDIKRLNSISKSLEFVLEETDYSIGFTNHGKTNPSSSYGVYSQTSFFDAYKKKEDAYANTVWAAEMLIHGASLNDPKAYHNYKEAA
jgi:hypothetical protein